MIEQIISFFDKVVIDEKYRAQTGITRFGLQTWIKIVNFSNTTVAEEVERVVQLNPHNPLYDDPSRFPKEWNFYINEKNKRSEISGYYLDQWAYLCREEVEFFKKNGIFTVEQLAVAENIPLDNIAGYKEEAAIFLSSKVNPDEATLKKMEELVKKLEVANDRIKELEDAITQLQIAGSSVNIEPIEHSPVVSGGSQTAPIEMKRRRQ